ncbi:sugar ABC transporter substrate-binding protein [Saccharothrix australiensis]|uniref:Monosaccharide ABC transporter substrate-binding protein (CUT2 family) n=1 Tax=Saccharothrix australiensis TaxID=2072 RepID=A0A495VVM9_9PSEU|nr:substrate-binding domain-containing protein [Saccharothrix australiensis]RKT53422.1 monosaccharide ABC transporter substrate-binding protein (CUT2 family) [Saccharothrix australiensis]
MRSRSLALVAVGTGLAVALTACGANTSGGGGPSGATTNSGSGGAKVGVILPETATSARWEGFDKPLLEQALKARGLDPDIQNAQGEVQKFTTLADGMINAAVKVLIIAAPNSEVGAAVAKKAQAQGIHVIDYDRLNLGGSSVYHVSFDNVKVGELQGQGLVQGLAELAPGKKPAEVIEIEGAPTDNNATLFTEGQKKVLQPKYDAGDYELVRSQPIEGWDNQKGGTTFEQILTGNGQQVDGVVAANDGLAGAVITVLKKFGLNGKVPVTGQDATPEGLQAVLRGDQYMTVFKPIAEEAEAAAKLADALAKDDTAAADALATGVSKDPKNNRDVKSILLTPQLITKDKVKTVVDAGFVKATEICTPETQPTCTTLGIN